MNPILQPIDPTLRAIGITREAVRAAMGTPTPRAWSNTPKPELAAKIHEMHRAGIGTVEIAAKLKISRSSVYRYLTEYEA